MLTKIIAEIGINHNGDLQMAKSMISLARIAGCNFAKIQKRNPDVCVPEDQKNKERITPWGKMSYLEYKKRLEFDEEQIVELLEHSKKEGIVFFASVWDKDSVDLMAKYTKITKIPSALINDLDLCRYAREKFDFLIISTGMSREQEVVACVEACNPDVIMHTNSTYPCPMEDLNLRYIEHLKQKYPNKEIGYSGHEFGLVSTFAAQAIGATWIERHITLDRTMWGSDQLSSVEPSGLFKLVKGIRDLECAMKYEPQERILFAKEFEKMKTLRKVTEKMPEES